MVIMLDTYPASSTGKLPGKPPPTMLDQCLQWVNACEAAGHQILIPAIAYHEALRELEMRRAASQINRLKDFCLQPKRFVSLTTNDLETAAQLWGQARRAGQPTADPQALDGDVILAAQAMGLGLPPSQFVIATTNPGHLSRYAPCDLWTNIKP
jgi:predicted nucleic acid-binding protein